MSAPRSSPDVVIAGAGIAGLSLALELHRRGAHVTVLETGVALRQTSWAAAGMLAADDPHNPLALHPLAQFSRSLYRAYLDRIEWLAGLAVPFQTDNVVQYLPSGVTRRLAEHSLDPRQLATALLAAIRATSIVLHENVQHWGSQERDGQLQLSIGGVVLHPAHLVLATGAWFRRGTVTPRKGQMLRVGLPAALDLREVHRRADIYIVPRTQGPHAGTALIGATDEDAGYDTTTHTPDLDRLRALAAELLPAFASPEQVPLLESWAGLRPRTPDNLPLLGQLTERSFAATGHYRNGILLAPATAVLLADHISGNPPAIDLTPFDPQRFL
jgi:glycine oxidase